MDGVLELRIVSTISVERLESMSWCSFRARHKNKVFRLKDRPMHLRNEVSLDGNLQKIAIQGRQ